MTDIFPPDAPDEGTVSVEPATHPAEVVDAPVEPSVPAVEPGTLEQDTPVVGDPVVPVVEETPVDPNSPLAPKGPDPLHHEPPDPNHPELDEEGAEPVVTPEPAALPDETPTFPEPGEPPLPEPAPV